MGGCLGGLQGCSYLGLLIGQVKIKLVILGLGVGVGLLGYP